MMTQLFLTAYVQLQTFSFHIVLCVGCEHVNGEQQLRDSICVFLHCA